MKFTSHNINGHKIAVYSSEGTKKAVVFLHANSIGAASFYKQMMSKESKTYKYIAIDFPGHGASDFSLTPKETYTINGLAKIANETINKLDINKCVLCGHSLGGHITLRLMAKYNNPKVTSLLLTGMSPLENYNNWENAYIVDDIFNIFTKPRVNNYDASALAQLFIKKAELLK